MTPGPTEIIGCPGCGALHKRATIGSGNSLGARLWSDGKLEAPMLPDLPTVTRCVGCGRIFWIAQAPCFGQVSPSADLFPSSPPIEEVVVQAIGPHRVRMMAVLREYLSTDLAATKRLLEQVPFSMLRDAPPHLKRQACEALVAAGAVVEATRSGSAPPEIPMAWRRAPWVITLDATGYRDAIREGLAGTLEQEVFLRTRAWWADNDPFRAEGAAWIPIARRPPAVRENLERLYAILSQEDTDPQARLLRAEAARELGRFAEALAILERGVEADRGPAAESIAALARRGADALAHIDR